MVVTVSSPVTILNVDDHEISRYSRSRLLRQAGYEVKEAVTGHEALHILRQERPSLVLLDMHLPDISGLEVCRSIKNDRVLASTMVLEISASHISSQERVRGLESGADSYLTEPMEPDELIAHVKALLRLAEAEKKLVGLNETLEERVRGRTALLQLLHEIAVITNEVGTVEETLQFTLERICAYTDWPVGHAYWLNREKPDELISSGIWHLDDPERFAAFRRATEAARFPVGVGLPGQVLASGELTWVIDVSQLHLQRAAAAVQSGVQVGFGFPLWAGQEIRGVLEFFTDQAVEPGGSFLEGMTQIGMQLGRVVERRRAEQRLRESQEQLQRLNVELEQRVAERTAQLTASNLELRQANERFALVEVAAGGFHYEWDVETDTVVRSEGLTRILGYKPDELAATWEAWMELTHPDDLKFSKAEAIQFFNNLPGETFSSEYRVHHRQGHYCWLYECSLAERDAQGQVRRIIGQAVDISKRKQLEESLREQQVILQSFYDSTPFLMGIAELDDDRTVAVSGNRAMADFLEVRPEDLLGKTGIALGNPAEFEWLLVENYRRSQREGAPVHFDYEYPRPAGPLWLSVTAAPVGTGLNRNSRFSFVIEDVTRRKRVEEELRQSEERFRLAIEHSPIIPAACDRELRYLWIYNAHPHFHGRQLIGKRDDELALAEDVAELMALKQGVLASGSASRREIRIRVTGQDRFYDVSAKPLRDVEGLIYGVATIATDITERKLVEEAAQKSLAFLAEMRERNRLAQELHDTVAQALGYLNLKISIAHSALANHQVKVATAHLHELKGVINETYTDVREEIFYLRAKALSDLSFMELLQQYVEKYRRFYNLEIQLIQEADPAQFDFSPEMTAQLVRTVQEALINVRKHARVNRATIRLGQSGDALRISIEDTGQGFDLAQNGSKSSSYGLQIMRERMESIGGRLEIATAPGQGTRIVLHYRTRNQDSS
jgi:PAS domain S-box-containing protein